MSNLPQVWRLLQNYVRGTRSADRPTTKYVGNRSVLPLGKHAQKLKRNVNFSQVNLQREILCKRLRISLENWTRKDSDGEFQISDRQLHEEIYDLLGDSALTIEVVETVIELLVAEKQLRPVPLFVRLEDFYQRWCRGQFIDAPANENLPQRKLIEILAQNQAIGLRQIDIFTGLNVLILLLELHRHAQKQDELRQQINFYPSSAPDTDSFFTSQLLRIINYSDAIEIGNFSNIVGEFLRGGNFHRAYFGNANLTGVNFSGADLSGAYLGDANLTGANFQNANLTGANLGDANLSSANFTDANLSGADLTSANLTGATLNRADLNRADLSRADLRDTELCRANLSNAILFGANLSDAILNHVDLSRADLCRADLSGADLSHATLNGTNLSDTILFSTNLSHASLIAADLSYGKLNGAKLNHAKLNGAMFLGADLSGVDLTGVVLNDADLSGGILNEADLTDADLTDAVLLGTDFSFANLNNANLSGSNLSGAILNGADLTSANLSDAILDDTDISEANLEEMTWGEQQQWEGVRGLETALNIPEALREQLGLRE